MSSNKKCALLSFRLTRTGRKFMILSREFCAIENRQTIHSRYAADVIRWLRIPLLGGGGGGLPTRRRRECRTHPLPLPRGE